MRSLRSVDRGRIEREEIEREGIEHDGVGGVPGARWGRTAQPQAIEADEMIRYSLKSSDARSKRKT